MTSQEIASSSYVLGIDGGGTKTACVLLASDGTTIARAEGQASNYQAVGAAVAQANIRRVIEQVIDRARRDRPEQESDLEISGIGLGLAGAALPEDVAVVRSWVTDYIQTEAGGCHWNFQADDRARVYIDGDCAIALTGGIGLSDSVGIAAIAGTGSIVFGRNKTHRTVRVGGWGYLLGDEGSGYDIARRGLKAALHAADGRGEATQLLEEFQQQFRVRSPRELVMAIYSQHLPVRELAALAKIVDRVAVAGDAVARRVIDRGAIELGLAIRVCARQLAFAASDSFEIVTIGGVWQSQAGFRDRC